jgi:microcystin-dependent protein
MPRITLKKSSITGKVPTSSDLALGELAINTNDGKLFLKKNDGVESIVEVGPLPMVGEIKLVGFNIAPKRWMKCEGQLLNIADYPDLYATISTTFGGDGVLTFALPDMRGRVPVHTGVGPTQTTTYAQTGGTDPQTVNGTGQVILTVDQLPTHSHIAPFTGTGGSNTTPLTATMHVSNDDSIGASAATGDYIGAASTEGTSTPLIYAPENNSGTVTLNPNTITVTGNTGGITGGTVDIDETGVGDIVPLSITTTIPAQLPPFIALSYIICVMGSLPAF